jgi:hypothetical protein
MYALPPEADIGRQLFDVSFVPLADIAISANDERGRQLRRPEARSSLEQRSQNKLD